MAHSHFDLAPCDHGFYPWPDLLIIVYPEVGFEDFFEAFGLIRTDAFVGQISENYFSPIGSEPIPEAACLVVVEEDAMIEWIIPSTTPTNFLAEDHRPPHVSLANIAVFLSVNLTVMSEVKTRASLSLGVGISTLKRPRP